MPCRRILITLLLLIICPGLVQAGGISGKWELLPKERKVLYVNIGMASAITLWGVANWDYFQNAPTTGSEGWFGRDTDSGGADKIGHAYTGYIYTHAFASAYQAWGYEHEVAGIYGSLSSFGVQTIMEVGDSFSNFGFSYEDFIINAAGTAMGYLSWRYPKINDKLDFRAEYKPAFDKVDFTTDYEHFKYFLALKLNGFEQFHSGPLSYLELHLGYFTRGYTDQDPDNNERNLYVGIGINLSNIFRQRGYKKVSTFLNYYQVPYTYLPYEHDFND